MSQHRLGPAMLLALGVLACESSLTVPERETSRLMQTDRLSYSVEEGDRGYRALIPFTYENRADELVSVVNCNGTTAKSLEKRVDGEWIHAWGNVTPACLSAPIEIEPGKTYSGAVHFFAGYPSNNTHPKLEVDDVEGRYRIVWHNVVHNYDTGLQGFGDPLPSDQRTSNAFLLVTD